MNFLPDLMTWAGEMLFVVFISLLFYFTGVLFRFRENNEQSASSFFIPLFTGMLTWIILCAVFFTCGKTIMLLFMVPLGWMAYKKIIFHGPFFKKIIGANLKKNILFLLVFSLLFTLKASFLWSSQRLNPDNVFCSRVIHSLILNGQENEFHFMIKFNPEYSGMSPYHYFELWLSAFVFKLHAFSETSSTLRSYLCIATPLIDLVLLFGITEIINPGKRIKPVAALTGLLVMGTSLPLFNPGGLLDKFVQFGYVYYSPFVINEAKFFMPLLLFVFCYHFIQRYGISFIFIPLTLLPIASFASLPSVTGGAILLFILLLLLRKKFPLTIREISFSFLLFITTVVLIVLIYNSGVSTSISREGIKPGEILHQELNDRNSIFFIFKIAIAGILSILVYLFIPLVLSAVNYRMNPKPGNTHAIILQILLLFILCSGVFAWSILNHALNSIQLFSICAPAGLLLIVLGIQPFISNTGLKKGKIIVAGMLIYLVIGNRVTASGIQKEYSDLQLSSYTTAEFETETIRDLERTDEKRIAFIMSPEDYNIQFACYPHFSSPFNELASYHTDITMISLSETTWKRTGNILYDKQCSAGIKLGVFYNYIKNKGLDPFTSGIFPLQRSFCEENHIHFLIATPKAQTGEWGKSLSLIRTDRHTGLRFFRIE